MNAAASATPPAASSAVSAEPALGSSPAMRDSTPEASGASKEQRTRSGGSTRGLIQCGDSSCEPGKQACAASSEWKCVSKDEVPADAEVVYFCDDGTDCPASETCCLGYASAVEAYVCTRRRGPETECRLEICAEGGASCPKGQACLEGTCRSPERSATCGNERCPSARPICVWSERGAACRTWQELSEESDGARAALQCSRRADCGPEARCCTNAIWTATQCLTNCDSANEGEICTSDADCTAGPGSSRQGKCLSVKDRDVGSLPPWLEICAYDP